MNVDIQRSALDYSKLLAFSISRVLISGLLSLHLKNAKWHQWIVTDGYVSRFCNLKEICYDNIWMKEVFSLTLLSTEDSTYMYNLIMSCEMWSDGVAYFNNCCLPTDILIYILTGG